MTPSKLIPGYTKQYFSQFRIILFDRAEAVNKKNKSAGVFVGISIRLISKASEFVELPIRIIEDFALFMINGIGVANQGCRKNLKYCCVVLMYDLLDSALTICMCAFKVTIIATAIFYTCAALHYRNKDLIKEADTNRTNYYKIEAIRVHGYDKIAEAEKASKINDSLFSPIRLSWHHYKLFCTLSAQRLQETINYLRGLRNQNNNNNNQGPNPGPIPPPAPPPNINAWKEEKRQKLNEAVSELEKDESDHKNTAILVLKQEYEDTINSPIPVSDLVFTKKKKATDFEKQRVKTYLCKLMEIDPNTEFDEIKRKYRRFMLILHPDRNNGPYLTYYTQASNHVTTTFGIFESAFS